MFIVTDALGYIGQEFIAYINQQGYYDIVGFDEEEKLNQKHNNLIVTDYKSYKVFQNFLETHANLVQAVFILNDNEPEFLTHNLWIWEYATKNGIPLVAMNQKFEWNKQKNQPWFWVNFNILNIYGGNEDRRLNNKSEIYKLLNTDEANVEIDVQKIVDLIHINDVVKILLWTIENRNSSKNGNYKLSLYQSDNSSIEEFFLNFNNKNIQINRSILNNDNHLKDFFTLGYKSDFISIYEFYKH